jgi:hypothetical protein
MLSPAIIAALQTFSATLAFVTVCLALTKALVDAGFLERRDVLKTWRGKEVAENHQGYRIRSFLKNTLVLDTHQKQVAPRALTGWGRGQQIYQAGLVASPADS